MKWQRIKYSDPRSTQSSYRRNRKRTLRSITNDNSSSYAIPQEELINQFYGNDSPDVDLTLFDIFPECNNTPDDSPFTPNEIISKVRGFDNTAPGPDRLTYQHWLGVDPDGKALAAIFNICLKATRIPSLWKESNTIFIPKGDDPDNPSNWRLIALCPTIAKIYSGLITKRINNWFEANDIFLTHRRATNHSMGASSTNTSFRNEFDELVPIILSFACFHWISRIPLALSATPPLSPH